LSDRIITKNMSLNPENLDPVPCGISPKENYCWLDFQHETHLVQYASEDEALNQILPRLRKVMAIVVGGRGSVIIKDHTDNPFAVKKLNDLIHRVCYTDDDNDNDGEASTDEDSERSQKKIKIKCVPIRSFVEKHLNLMPCYNRIVFKPNNIGLEPREINIWANFKANQVDQVDMTFVQPWLNHIREVWASDNDHLYRYIMSWIKQVLTHPERPSGIALIIHGKPGSGKTVVAEFLSRFVFGRGISLTTSGLSALTDRFNGCLMGKVFVNANELTTTSESFHSTFDRLKAIITDPWIQIEEKGLERFEIQNCINILGTTNHRFGVSLEQCDRRYACFTCADSRIGDRPYFDSLVASMNQTHGDHFFTYMLNFQDVVEIRIIPDTELRNDMMANSMPVGVRFISALSEDPASATGHATRASSLEYLYDIDPATLIVSKDHLYSIYKQWASQNTEKLLAANTFAKQIKEAISGSIRSKHPRNLRERVQCFRLKSPECSPDEVQDIKRRRINLADLVGPMRL
jgi:hypothetical protein